MSKINESMRVRYGRLSGRKPKNTLVTVRYNDEVYFGIARCNTRMDTFHRKVGTYIAKQRALLAAEESEELDHTYAERDGVAVHHSGLRGTVSVDNVKSLIEHFNNIDEYCLLRLPEDEE